ncbi:hypothetical protein NP493_16g01032 [Ridgeia piscesae]|uniref:Katanin p80 subunit C-terminal domain-containing protein n=1 Tax=Ridgeia piscesae TaxID=27915 RepID=A0AAD9PEL5_RIDPI|nr:hypothetical protein NP493_16g01032 [Ridgeia piscesae]
MITILSGRRMRLQAAATLWRQCGGGALVSYLLKVNDESVTADILPILVNSLHRKEKSWNELSVETCFELQPLIKQLLHSKYEE